MLYTPKYDEPSGRYCGPTAICAVTGLPLSVVKAAIRQASGKITDAAGRAHRVSGVAPEHLVGAMALLGWNVVGEAEHPHLRGQHDHVTFRDFCHQCGDNGPFIVNVTGHYIAVGWGEICDPMNDIGVEMNRYFSRQWKPRARGRYQGAWVHRWWRFAP